MVGFMNMDIRIITSLADAGQRALFDKVFALYERMFPENERHSYDALVANLNANHTRDVKSIWAAALDDNGDVLGGCGGFVSGDLIVVAYMMVDDAARGRGVARKLEQAIITHVDNGQRMFLVCDVEDPQKMVDAGITSDEYDESVRLYNITVFDRLVFWRDRMGYRAVDFPYALLVDRPGVEPTTILKLHVKGVEGGKTVSIDTIDADMLRTAAALLNCHCLFGDIPAHYRDHPAMTAMWAHPAVPVPLSDHMADEFNHLRDHWKRKKRA